jgi:hypothetical protein
MNHTDFNFLSRITVNFDNIFLTHNSNNLIITRSLIQYLIFHVYIFVLHIEISNVKLLVTNMKYKCLIFDLLHPFSFTFTIDYIPAHTF